MSALPFAFASPMILLALGLLPLIWWLLRLTPPKPQTEPFPPFVILARLVRRDETPARSPWWLTLIRLAMAGLVILAMAGPVYNPQKALLEGAGPLLVVIDDGWASAPDWESRRNQAQRLIAEAGAKNRTILLAGTSADAIAPAPLDAASALRRLEAMNARPLEPNHVAAASHLAEAVRQHSPEQAHVFSDGLGRNGDDALAAVFNRLPVPPTLYVPDTHALVAMAGVRNDPDALTGVLVRAGGDALAVEVTAYDAKNLPVARRQFAFGDGERSLEFRFDEPVEMRNQIMRAAVSQARTAGAVQLLDDSFRRRVVGLISGQSTDLSQPLLSPLHYISKALAPYSDVRQSEDANSANAIQALIGQGVSAIILADIGRLPGDATAKLGQWIEKGGMLVRFAGPRLAASADELLPVRLRGGDRNLGGALSWETPKPVAPFETSSPFFGIEAPREVLVRRQVLAAQEPGLESRTWAVLEDGTPLVTAAPRGGGWIVLFHTSSDASWSNLAISGTFVDMLRRVVSQARLPGSAAAAETVALPPLSVMDAEGRLGAPGIDTKPLVLNAGIRPKVSVENPPGLYGTQDGFVVVNLFSPGDTIAPLDPALFGQSASVRGYEGEAATMLGSWLLLLAAILLALDCLAVLWIAGALRLPAMSQAARSAAIVLIAVSLAAGVRGHAAAQGQPSDAIDFSAALVTRLAYVVTGDSDVDAVSKAGLAGLTAFLASRTALEPGAPAAIDLTRDELSFYPLLYWPVLAGGPAPDAAAMARVDAFMKQGGSILFDTRDQVGGVLGGTAASPEALRLQALLANLDIPPLEPVPPEHVLTKAFYLLTVFPGRYSGGDLWVEALPPPGENAVERPARAGDGVSSILITSNDLAGAWAVDDALQPMFATIPPDPAQRELSFRVGVNIVMYVLTGNYKADQVHVPALLERLGQ